MEQRVDGNTTIFLKVGVEHLSSGSVQMLMLSSIIKTSRWLKQYLVFVLCYGSKIVSR